MVFYESLMGVWSLRGGSLIGYFNEVLRVFAERFEGVSMKFQGCFKNVSRVFQGSFKRV